MIWKKNAVGMVHVIENKLSETELTLTRRNVQDLNHNRNNSTQ